MDKSGPFDALTKQETIRPNLAERYSIIARLGTMLMNREVLAKEQREFLGSSLQRIADGVDPYVALGLEVDRPGQKREGLYKAHLKRKSAIGWIAAASDKSYPESLTVAEAIAVAARHFGYTRGTMEKMWKESNKSPFFKL
jgi:hypothetical protein